MRAVDCEAMPSAFPTHVESNRPRWCVVVAGRGYVA